MRRMSQRLPRDERGATMAFVAVTIVILFGFTALGVDVSHLAHERGRIQHAADAAAFAVAYDCVSSDTSRQAKCDPTAGQPTVDEFVAADSAGDEGAITNDPASEDKVTVEVDQAVNHYFAPVIGIDTSDAHAKATVSWKKHVVAGKTLPYAVSICHWMQTPIDTEVLLDASVNDNSGEINGWKHFTNQSQFDALPASTWQECSGGAQTPPPSVTVPSGTRTVHDGLWFSEDNCSNNVSNSAADLVLGEKVCGSSMNTGPAWKYPIADGETILLAVYAPDLNWTYGGLCADDATGNLGKCPAFSSGSNPLFQMKVVGFVPFEVSGCRYGKPAHLCGGNDPSTQGLRGKFVTTSKPFEDAEYDETGNNFGAVKVELVE